MNLTYSGTVLGQLSSFAIGLVAIVLATTAGATPVLPSPVEVTLSVQVKDERILVRTRFENKGSRTVLVKEGEYGYGFGDSGRTCDVIGTPGNPEFALTTWRDEAIRYRGWRSHYAPRTKALFKPIAPGQVIDVRCTRLDGSYAFLPGTHDYKVFLIHLEYDEDTDKILVHRSEEAQFTYTSP